VGSQIYPLLPIVCCPSAHFKCIHYLPYSLLFWGLFKFVSNFPFPSHTSLLFCTTILVKNAYRKPVYCKAAPTYILFVLRFYHAVWQRICPTPRTHSFVNMNKIIIMGIIRPVRQFCSRMTSQQEKNWRGWTKYFTINCNIKIALDFK